MFPRRHHRHAPRGASAPAAFRGCLRRRVRISSLTGVFPRAGSALCGGGDRFSGCSYARKTHTEWRQVLMPRYTQTVGHVGQIATALLIVLVAGGPALASVCEAMCVPPAATTEPTAVGGSHGRGHHHQPAAQAAEAQQTAARHDHHQSGEAPVASSRGPQVGRFLARDCCTELAPPRPSLTASRVDTDLLPGSHAAVVSSAMMLAMRDRQPAGPTHGPPPGVLSSARTPLVLRI